ncbi:hypothetical protein L7E35_004672 [Vibrio parahaemolyticus]|nr:hypothetical protein [Vibrio parahaemolyticus]EIV1599726.1 hypothetical protein [Vibrio parahaemolyticus]
MNCLSKLNKHNVQYFDDGLSCEVVFNCPDTNKDMSIDVSNVDLDNGFKCDCNETNFYIWREQVKYSQNEDSLDIDISCCCVKCGEHKNILFKKTGVSQCVNFDCKHIPKTYFK